jgi:hypothetical protein
VDPLIENQRKKSDDKSDVVLSIAEKDRDRF